ncbi:hypothetical protein LMG7974_01370 [Campylobacter majalis]|uniref:Cell division protein FtsX n=1 Tax=Campylobacter majalis TaxID=2790656 RepID=A0ABN7K9F5_9BACT|nr:cell division protein FtsX [Campylobacter majalis]CAD7289159.1 hypothetical protein LMG7974_01370 [Campylobacter majalis]
MRSFKNHFSFFLALSAILFAVAFFMLSSKVVKEYEKLMNNDYNIIIVATKELNENAIKPAVPTLMSMQIMSSDKIINRLNNDISAKNLSILQNSLPKFYTLKLNALPSSEYMKELRNKLIKIDGVNKVETFARTHDKVYRSLKLSKAISQIFMFIVGFIGLLLMAKQVDVWIYEHQERIDIMRLFGAGFWLKSAVLYKSGFFASVFSTAFVCVVFYLLPTFGFANTLKEQISIVLPTISIDEILSLFAISFLLSILVVSIVMKKV